MATVLLDDFGAQWVTQGVGVKLGMMRGVRRVGVVIERVAALSAHAFSAASTTFGCSTRSGRGCTADQIAARRPPLM